MTNSATSGSEATPAFSRLHPEIQRWIWDHGWTELRQAQVEAAPPILAGDVDVILSAATASGKTEAAFLPILSVLAANPAVIRGVEVLYLSPLKALINDQFDRLSELAERVDLPIHRWHGDVSGGHKDKVLRKPAGLLLITPESLEALFVLRGSQVPAIFAALRYVVVDELHSFIGTERGSQLQSLLNRIELGLRHRVPRIALSATLSDMDAAADFLRPGQGDRVCHINVFDEQALKLQLRGYLATPPRVAPREVERAEAAGQILAPDDTADGDELAIAADLFETLRSSDNLIFANRRRDVEIFTDLLRSLSEQSHVPNEFFPHHGSLSKELREYVETRLKDRTQPVNAVCTSTLEMGIDIGAVRSIAQIGAPPSVASMRQRLGRSGRRGDPAVLRIYVSEEEIDAKTPPPDALRAELVQSIAMIDLLLERWCEPAAPGRLHLSTLIQQLLSLIAQYGGVLAADAYSVLCGSGPFTGVETTAFAVLLRHLGGMDIVVQDGDGSLLLGVAGERIVNHFSFYAAFATPEEWRLVTDGHTLGSLPVDFPLSVGLFLIFAGRRWRVVAVDLQHKTVDLLPAPAGRPPRFTGTGAPVHDRVRQKMFDLYRTAALPQYLDTRATDLLTEARQNFSRFRLAERHLVPSGEDTYLFLWAGDRIVNTVVGLFGASGLAATKDGLALSVSKVSPVELAAHLMALLAADPPDALDLAAKVPNKATEKFDAFLPEELLNANYAERSLDVRGAWATLQVVVDSAVAPDSGR